MSGRTDSLPIAGVEDAGSFDAEAAEPASYTAGEATPVAIFEDPLFPSPTSPDSRRELADLTRTYRANYPRLHKLARRIVGSTEAADDIVQQAFLNTADSLKSGTDIAHLGAYVKRCVYNLSIKRVQRAAVLPLEEEITDSKSDSPHELAQAKERWQQIYGVVGELAPAQRAAFVLAELHGYRHEEIASAMDRSEVSVRQLLSRARTRIRNTVGADAPPLMIPPILLTLPFKFRPPIRARVGSLNGDASTTDRGQPTALHSVGNFVATRVGDAQSALAAQADQIVHQISNLAVPVAAATFVVGVAGPGGLVDPGSKLATPGSEQELAAVERALDPSLGTPALLVSDSPFSSELVSEISDGELAELLDPSGGELGEGNIGLDNGSSNDNLADTADTPDDSNYGDDQGGDEGNNQGGDEGNNQGGDEGNNQGGDEGNNQGGDEGNNQGGDEGNNQGGDVGNYGDGAGDGGNDYGDGGDNGVGEGDDLGDPVQEEVPIDNGYDWGSEYGDGDPNYSQDAQPVE